MWHVTDNFIILQIILEIWSVEIESEGISLEKALVLRSQFLDQLKLRVTINDPSLDGNFCRQ